MKRYILLSACIVFYSNALGQTNTFPSSGNVGIGTLTPATLFDVKYGIDVGGSSTGFIAPYYIGYTNDVGAGQSLQYILLCPLIVSGYGNPSAGLSGTLSAYRGDQGSYNVSAEYRVLIQAAYSNDNNVSVIPVSQSSPLINIYSVIYNGQLYAALKISEISGASYRATFLGHWWNNINGTKPQLVDASAVSAVSVYKNYESVLGGNIYANMSSNVGIGTTDPQSKLAVNGTITAKEVKVTQTGWPDFVFDSAYQLPALSNIEAFIKANHHLPDMPAAKEIESNGLNLGSMGKMQMQKIEELTLYVIKLQKEVEQLKTKIEQIGLDKFYGDSAKQ
ncbi:MAG: hypothetical protein EPN39_05430 [Chitinophagaceae bacterium]|nr:MAG: hypothetical protein EPN39_05430 [Chitinophagaceae bacterium]